ncbi:MAG: hypothetical protein K2Q11_11435 [Burkholderiaceae bacterium]|nr:hypothetical protein [Burkholderiaceae bacterium]
MTAQTPSPTPAAPIEPPAPPAKPLGYWVLLTTSEGYATACPTGAALYVQYIRAGEAATAPLNPTKGLAQ